MEKVIPQYLAWALLILKPNSTFEMTLPAKLQAYVTCGVPIIGCANGEVKKVIEKANAVVVANEVSMKLCFLMKRNIRG